MRLNHEIVTENQYTACRGGWVSECFASRLLHSALRCIDQLFCDGSLADLLQKEFDRFVQLTIDSFRKAQTVWAKRWCREHTR